MRGAPLQRNIREGTEKKDLVMKSEKQMIEAQPVQFPLSDGTHAVITAYALRDLRNNRDVITGRMKKGAGGNSAVYVSVEKHDGKGTVELPLRDMLAAFTYRIRVEDSDQKYFLIDGDPRNLLPSNIGVTPRKEIPFVVERAAYKPRALKPRPAGAMSVERQREVLQEMNEAREFHIQPDENGAPASERERRRQEFSILFAIGLKIGTAARMELIAEIVAELNLSLLEQIQRGAYAGINGARGAEEQRLHFAVWVKNSARTQFRARLCGRGDIETQPIVSKLQNDFVIERDRQGRRVHPHGNADAQLSSPSLKVLNRERKAAGIALVEVPQKFPAKKKKAA